MSRRLLETLRRGPAQLTEESFRGLTRFHDRIVRGESLVPEKKVSRRQGPENNGKKKRSATPPKSMAPKSKKKTAPSTPEPPQQQQKQQQQPAEEADNNSSGEATEHHADDSDNPDDLNDHPSNISSWTWEILCLLGILIMGLWVYLMKG